MDNETTFTAVFCSILLGVFIAVGYGSYRYGISHERKDYTAGFIKNVEAAYWEGYHDGVLRK